MKDASKTPDLSPEALAFFREQGRIGGKIGGKIAQKKLTPAKRKRAGKKAAATVRQTMTADERKARAQAAAQARWAAAKKKTENLDPAPTAREDDVREY